MTGLLIVLLLNIGLHTRSASKIDATCDQEGWVFYENSGICFFLQEDLANYEFNKRTCVMMEATLALVRDNDTADFLREHIDYFKNKVGSARVSSPEEMSWTWDDTSESNTTEEECSSCSFSFNGTSQAPCLQPMVTLCMRTYSDKCLFENGGCQHGCHMLNSTRVCSCPSDFILANETHCTSANPCEIMNGGCAQMCFNPSPGRKVCSCDDRFVLLPHDGVTCALQSQREQLPWKEILAIALFVTSFGLIFGVAYYGFRRKSEPRTRRRMSTFRRSVSSQSDTFSSMSMSSSFDSNGSAPSPPLVIPPLKPAPFKAPPSKDVEGHSKPDKPETPGTELSFKEQEKGPELPKKKDKSVTSFFSAAKGSRVRISTY